MSSLSLILSAENSFAATTAESGFSFPKVAAEVYELQLQGAASSQYFVKSVRAGGIEFNGPLLDLRHTGDLPVTVTLSDKGAAVNAAIKTDTPDPQHMTVILIPDIPAADQREHLTRQATPDYNGIFTIHNIPPGDYRLFAWLDLPETVWNDPDFWSAIRDKGAAVTLGESEKKSLEVPLIPATEIASSLTRLGLR